jgi:hypothetical protein
MLVTLRRNQASLPSALNVTAFVFFVVEDSFLIGANPLSPLLHGVSSVSRRRRTRRTR